MPCDRYAGGASAFTLLELLVVLFIIGLMSAVVVPRLIGPLSGVTLETAARKTVQSLRWARSQAVARRRSVTVRFDPRARRLSVMYTASLDAAGQETQQLMEGQFYVFPEGVAVENADASSTGAGPGGSFDVVFYPTGQSSGAAIILKNDSGRTCRIVVDFITGEASLAGGAS